MKKNCGCSFFCSLFLCVFSPFVLFSREIHVKPSGNDANPGTLEKPFRTVQAALIQMQAGDICILHEGVYREIIDIKAGGTATAPITIRAAKGEKPVISGLDVFQPKWETTDKANIYVTDFSGEIGEQIFMDDKPMLEARWPNIPRDKEGNWDFFSPNVWSSVDNFGNRYGTIKDRQLAATGWNITGAKAVLNVAHQYFTWTRIVDNHVVGSDSFQYPKDLGSSVKGEDEAGHSLTFNDDRYYLLGKKEFLDAEGEWYLDVAQRKLYVCMPKGIDPNDKHFEIKSRYFSMTSGKGADYIIIEGLCFLGTAFRFGVSYYTRSNNIVFKNNQVYYFLPRITSRGTKRTIKKRPTKISLQSMPTLLP